MLMTVGMHRREWATRVPGLAQVEYFHISNS